MTSIRSRTRSMTVLLVAAGLLLAACGSTSGVAAAVPSTSSSVDGDTSTPTVGAPDAATDSSGSSGGDTTKFVSLDMSVRVVNLFISRATGKGAAIDVWAGQGHDSSSKKLMTIPYGQVSDYFAPAVSGSTDGATAHIPYTLTFYPAGNSTTMLGQQNENSAPEQKLTMILGPGDSTTAGGELQVAADRLGSGPEGGGFTATSIPEAPAGKAVVELSALGLENPPGSSSPTSLEMSTSSGTCEQFFDPDTGRLNDPKSASTRLTGGTTPLAYVVQPGEQVRVNQVKEDEDVTSACRDEPVATLDPKLSAGQGGYAFLYGTDIKTAMILFVPVG